MYAGQVVEEATLEEIFLEPLHPYTKGLIDSVPSLSGEIKELKAIKGNVPPLENLPKGCRFAPRCEHAFERCWQAAPELNKISDSRKVRCFLYDDETSVKQLKLVNKK